jgi:hypothetical protein
MRDPFSLREKVRMRVNRGENRTKNCALKKRDRLENLFFQSLVPELQLGNGRTKSGALKKRDLIM